MVSTHGGYYRRLTDLTFFECYTVPHTHNNAEIMSGEKCPPGEKIFFASPFLFLLSANAFSGK